MTVAVGNDIIFIPRVQELVDSQRLAKILQPSEIDRSSLEHIAGRIALKEAAIKALGLKPGDWQLLVITTENYRPVLEYVDAPAGLQLSCSISHDGDYAVATVIALYSDA